MTTSWTCPSTIIQYADPDAEDFQIPWDDSENFSNLTRLTDSPVKTTRDLIHIARGPRIDVTMKTWYLRATGFNFQNLPSVITGIETKIVAQRRGRITDETVQLCVNGSATGVNRGNLDLAPQKIYGGETDLWEADLTVDSIKDPTFGVLLRFQSHPYWPHKDSAFVYSVEVRIH